MNENTKAFKEQLYVVKNVGEDVILIKTEKEIRDMLKAFELDYIKEAIEDIYHSSKNSIPEGLFEDLREMQQWDLDFYASIDFIDFSKVALALSNSEIYIYKLGERI